MNLLRDEERRGQKTVEKPRLLQFPSESYRDKRGEGARGYSDMPGVDGGIGKAFGLTARGIISMVPPPGTGGRIPGERWAMGMHKDLLMDPAMVERAEPREPPPRTEVLCRDEEWGPVARILVGRGVCGIARQEEVPRWEGKMVMNGLFGVHQKW